MQNQTDQRERKAINLNAIDTTVDTYWTDHVYTISEFHLIFLLKVASKLSLYREYTDRIGYRTQSVESLYIVERGFVNEKRNVFYHNKKLACFC